MENIEQRNYLIGAVVIALIGIGIFLYYQNSNESTESNAELVKQSSE